MLVLPCAYNEDVVIGPDFLRLKVLRASRTCANIGFIAPSDLSIQRAKHYNEAQARIPSAMRRASRLHDNGSAGGQLSQRELAVVGRTLLISTSFTSDVLRLIRRANPGQRELLACAFPEAVEAIERHESKQLVSA